LLEENARNKTPLLLDLINATDWKNNFLFCNEGTGMTLVIVHVTIT